MPNKRTKTVLPSINAGTSSHGKSASKKVRSGSRSKKTSVKGTSTNGR